MSDLVTRLLALAVKMKDRSRHITYDDVDEGADALREAAAALSLLLKERDETPAGIYAGQLRVRIDDLEEERDGLKAKLAEAEAELIKSEVALDAGHVLVTMVRERAEKAEAEAAAYREALRDFSDNWDCDTGANDCHHDHCRACAAKRALSQPGPGAAYQERMRKLEDLLQTLTERAIRENEDGFRVVQALDALEEKP